MKIDNWFVVCVAGLVALAVIGLGAYALKALGTADPAVIGGMFGGLCALLAVIPRIIRAIRGSGR
ncbi:hypothetical protein ABT352_39100 [Streptosporangium sp. NPDC000563]|uniref:hypothetical protein n=1 Tax=Streptosporangium sp. NPDC000563 TaxID=3154366 RepID=UPI003320AF66